MVECVNILRKCRDDFLVRFKKTINRIRYSNQPNNHAVHSGRFCDFQSGILLIHQRTLTNDAFAF